jgi:hAT family C-terminal dimerisation region
LDPKNSFSSFNKDRLLQLALFYPSDFNQFEFSILASQLENYIMDVQDDRDFFEVDNLVELSQKLVETNRHNVYTLVYKLIKLGLLLPVATASVERVFSAMNLVKTDIRSSMGDKWMNDCLITFIEKKIFNTVDNERIMQRFQNMKPRRGKLSSLT